MDKPSLQKKTRILNNSSLSIKMILNNRKRYEIRNDQTKVTSNPISRGRSSKTGNLKKHSENHSKATNLREKTLGDHNRNTETWPNVPAPPLPPLKSHNHTQTSSINNFQSSQSTLIQAHKRSASLYKVPSQDIYTRNSLKKRENTHKLIYDQLCNDKYHNTMKQVFNEIIQPSNENLNGNGKFNNSLDGGKIIKVKIVVARSSDDVVYLERFFSVKSLVSNYILVNLRTEKQKVGCGSSKNEVLVAKILNFIKKAEHTMCVLKCRDDPRLFELFKGLSKFIRNDSKEDKLNIYVLEVNEVKLMKHLFFDFSPDFGIMTAPPLDSPVGEKETDNILEYQKKFKNEKKVFLRNTETEQDEEEEKVEQIAHPTTTGIKRSKWMEMIEQCLSNKDILYTSQSNFDNIFSKYPAKNKIKDIERAVTVKVPNIRQNSRNDGMEKIIKFKELLSNQIEEERGHNVFMEADEQSDASIKV